MNSLSVILPCYNGAPTISDQLDALASQGDTDSWELIVVDNRCTDNTMDIVEQYEGRIPRLKTVEAYERQGKPFALNRGVEVADGSALAFCDQDDVVSQDWISVMNDALDQYRMVAGRIDYQRLNEGWVAKARHRVQTDGLQGYGHPDYLSHAAGCNLGIEKDLLTSLGGFDEAFFYLSDTDLCWKAQLAGASLEYVPEAVVHYRFRETLRGTFVQAMNYAQENVLLYRKYRSHGMPRLDLKAQLLPWYHLLRAVPSSLIYPERFPRLAWRLGWRLGRVKGSLRYNVLAL